jgi:hypothetical protein
LDRLNLFVSDYFQSKEGSIMDQHIPSAVCRVAPDTNPIIDSEIRENTINELRSIQDANVDVINNRLDMLKEEWDIDRVLDTGASAFAVAGTVLGFVRSKKWFLLCGAAGGLLLMHAIKGMYPPVSILRRLGVRTGHEIANERMVLKMMRKDFEHIPQDVHGMMNIAEQ